MNTPYTYIFVRKDLSPAQQIVQASHAALEAGFRFNQPDTPTHIVLIGINDQAGIMSTADFLTDKGIDYELFFEPDHDIGYTSIATKPLVSEQRKPLRRFSLYNPQEVPC